jgi:glycosyltransferase involved in cell wall biosynthesis
MHIIEVHETNWIDRNVIQVHHLIERMVSRGHTCEIIDYDMLWPTRHNRKIWQPKQVFTNVNKVISGVTLRVIRPGSLQIPLVCHAVWAISSMVEMRQLIREKRPDVLLCTSLTNSYLMALMGKAIHIPFVYMVYEPYYTMVPQKWLKPIARLAEKLALRAAERVFVFTPQMKQYTERMGVQSGRIDVFKSGVGQEIFQAGVDGTNRRTELGIGPDEWVLFFMGWLYDFSGLRQIFQSIANDPTQLDAARLLVVGDGDIYTELKSIIEKHNLAPKILMTGKRPYKEIPALLATADVCLMPSLENNTTRDIVPMKVYEYLAVKRPLVATRLPGMLAEFGTESGILYTSDPLDALKQALSLCKKPDEVIARSKAGRKFAEQHADWEKTIDMFEEILISVKDRFTVRNKSNATGLPE